MENNIQLEFYEKYKLVTCDNDISNLKEQYQKREKLYRLCGIPTNFFENRTILEVGPAGGYTTLAFFEWGATADLIEPNSTAQENMKKLFEEHNIQSNKYKIYPCVVEDFKEDKKYSFICAEGFIPAMEGRKEIIDKLISLSADNGIIVITCLDELGMLIEKTKRLISLYLVKDIEDFDLKVEKLVPILAPQLKTLNGFSRTAEDWIRDNVLNPEHDVDSFLSINEALDYFPNSWKILGGSPNMISNYSFFKDISYDERKDYKNQFMKKRHNLLWTKLEETFLDVGENEFLSKKIIEIRKNATQYINGWADDKRLNMIRLMEEIVHLVAKIDEDLLKILKEMIDALETMESEQFTFEKYPMFYSAFGRTTQYLSMVKDREYK